MSPRNVETSPVIAPQGTSLLVRANEGRPLRAFGHAIVVLDGKQTGGKFTTFLNITTGEQLQFASMIKEAHINNAHFNINKEYYV